MGYYHAQQWDLDPHFALFRPPEEAWSAAPVAPVRAEADEDDWSGVAGSCHALRPAGAAPVRPAAVDDAADWGYDAHTL